MNPSVGHLLRQHYWTHIDLYPIHFRLSDDDEKELVAMLAHACLSKIRLVKDYSSNTLTPLTGNTRSTASNVPYNRRQCETFLRLIRNFPNSECAVGYRNIILSRLWFEIDRKSFVGL